MTSYSLKNILEQLDLGPVHIEQKRKRPKNKRKMFKKKFKRQRYLSLSLPISLGVNEQLNRSKLKRPKNT